MCLQQMALRFPTRHGRPFSADSRSRSTIPERDSRRPEWRFIALVRYTLSAIPETRAKSPDFPPATPGDFVSPQDAAVLGWNQYRIEVSNNVIKVALNGANTAKYTIPDPAAVHFPTPYDQNRPVSGYRTNIYRSAVVFKLRLHDSVSEYPGDGALIPVYRAPKR